MLVPGLACSLNSPHDRWTLQLKIELTREAIAWFMQVKFSCTEKTISLA